MVEKIMTPNGKHGIDYSEILEWMYLGTNQCCQVHFNGELLKKGVTVDVSMEAERIDAAQGIETFLWLPTTDHTAPTMSVLKMGIEVLKETERQGTKAYVHCMNGHGRAPTLVIAFFVVVKGFYLEDAIELVKNKRPSIHPEPEQIKQLQLLEKSVN